MPIPDYFVNQNGPTFRLMTSLSPQPDKKPGADNFQAGITMLMPNNISDAFENINSRYVFLLLYDEKNEQIVDDFFISYGAEISNKLGSDHMFTFYSREIYESWGNIRERELLNSQDFGAFDSRFDIMKSLAKSYKVTAFPSLILVDVKSNEISGDYYLVDQHIIQSPVDLYNEICVLLSTIDKYYGDFKRISDVVIAPVQNCGITLREQFERQNMYVLLDELLVKYNQKYGRYRRMNRYNLSMELNLSERQLHRKRTENSFKRDELIKLGILLKLSPSDMGRLLESGRFSGLNPSDPRDLIIIQCLNTQRSVDYTNELLRQKKQEDLDR